MGVSCSQIILAISLLLILGCKPRRVDSELRVSSGDKLEKLTPKSKYATKLYQEVVFLKLVNGICSGVMVLPDLVLTAAHCGKNADWVYIGDKPYAIRRLFMHPEYDKGRFSSANRGTHDLALVEVKISNGLDNVNTAPLNFYDLEYETDVAMVGFGEFCEVKLYGEKCRNKERRKVIGINYYSGDKTTHKEWVNNKVVYLKGSSSAESGDSGGPLYKIKAPKDKRKSKLDFDRWLVGIAVRGESNDDGYVHSTFAFLDYDKNRKFLKPIHNLYKERLVYKKELEKQRKAKNGSASVFSGVSEIFKKIEPINKKLDRLKTLR